MDVRVLFLVFGVRTRSRTIIPDGPPHQREEDPAAAEKGKACEPYPDTHEKLVGNIRGYHDTADEEGDDNHRNSHRQHLADKPHCAQRAGRNPVIGFCH